MEASINIKETSLQEITRIFELQNSNQYKIANSTARERRVKLKKLHKAILDNRENIKDALYKDFKKHPSEVDLTEIYPIVSELKYANKHLAYWMKSKKVETPFALIGSSSWIKYEPKGQALIISPWNFPVNLTFGPLVSAIAAGNTVILKPSEHTPHASAIMKKIISEVFEENEVALFEGGIETSQHLLELPFNHIFFTGSPAVGKIVMGAAAKNLTSVTLELGGKTPTIVDKTANLNIAAKRIVWGKFINKGQICIAPDYLLVHNEVIKPFTEKLKFHLNSFYSEDPSGEKSYPRMVNKNHYLRVKSYLEDARIKGANIEFGAHLDDDQNYISPTLVNNVPMDSKLMTEEIFGPVLPIHGFDNLEEVTQQITSGEKPLALYIYSRNKKNIRYLINNTRSGGTCINHNGVHFYNSNLPFGGVNNSGIGKANGYYGFVAFSNERGVLQQHIPNALELLVPPYNKFKQKLIDLTIKYF